MKRLRAERPDPGFHLFAHQLGGATSAPARVLAAYGAMPACSTSGAPDLLRSAEIAYWDGIIEGVGRLVAGGQGAVNHLAGTPTSTLLKASAEPHRKGRSISADVSRFTLMRADGTDWNDLSGQCMKIGTEG